MGTKQKSNSRSGFTIIELLIVIIVIGILAALILLGYNNISKQAAVTRIKNDVEQSYKQLDLFNVRNNRLPADQTEARSVVALSDGTTLEYTLTSSTSYCITTSSQSAQTNYYFDSTARSVVQGVCTGQVGYVNSSGVLTVSSIAGSGVSGFQDGPAASAKVQGPFGIVADSSGTVYFSDTSNYRIRKIAGGTVSTLAGSGLSSNGNDGTGTAAGVGYEQQLLLDGSGTIWFADTNGSTIRKVTPGGTVTTVAGVWGTGGTADGTGTAARFSGPTGMAIDSSGNFIIVDSSNNLIRKMTPSYVVTTLAGNGSAGTADGTGTAARFSNPAGMVIDVSGNYIIVDKYNHCIRKMTTANVVTTLAGLCGTPGDAEGTGSTARFKYPGNIVMDSSGNFLITDTYNSKIKKMTPAGVVTNYIGNTAGYQDGVFSSALLNYPNGLYMDPSGSIYVTDSGNNRIRKISQ